MTSKTRKFVEQLMAGFIQGSPHPNLWTESKVDFALKVSVRIAKALDELEANDV